jgi:hypothetical protein
MPLPIRRTGGAEENIARGATAAAGRTAERTARLIKSAMPNRLEIKTRAGSALRPLCLY